jgi:hypothetical protein
MMFPRFGTVLYGVETRPGQNRGTTYSSSLENKGNEKLGAIDNLDLLLLLKSGLSLEGGSSGAGNQRTIDAIRRR